MTKKWELTLRRYGFGVKFKQESSPKISFRVWFFGSEYAKSGN